MKSIYKPHIYWHAPWWRCQRQDPSKPGVIFIGDGWTPKQAYNYCLNIKH